jgi:glucose-6-phosphate 1-dehydrogenase
MDYALSTLELKDDTVIVVLGASGDLAKKKTVRCPTDIYSLDSCFKLTSQ